MNCWQASVSKVLTYSCVDGPGNRLVLFLQGCNFNCPSCHNPHTIGQCTHCGECVPACPVGALSLADGRVRFDPVACNQCDACLTACAINANPMVRHYSVAQVLAVARQHQAFLSGITLSGGEATLQLKFISALFSAIKADPALARLSCFIDSNGHLGEQSWRQLMPVTDAVMLDIKALDPVLHIELTGRDNAKSLRSAQLLHAAGKLHELRYLMIPGKTDTAHALDRLARWVATLGLDVRVRLNAFQHHGVRGVARTWPTMSQAALERAAEHLRAQGLAQVITPVVYL